MAKILNIETSSKNCSVSISENQEQLCLCEEVSESYKQSENLHKFIQWALEGAEISLSDLDAVAVGKGPGSYTGLRIGVASAKGFCFGNDIPLIGINTLKILASPYFDQKYEVIIPIMDARRMEVYTCVFNSKGEYLEENQAHILSEKSFEKYRNKNVLFVGDAVEKTEAYFREIIKEFPNNISFKLEYPSAKNMIPLSWNKYQEKEFEDVAYFDPNYLKEWK